MPTFKLRFIERNGEQEYLHKHVLDAQDAKSAEDEAHEYLRDFYEDECDDFKRMEEYWHCGYICLGKISITETSAIKDNFTEEELLSICELAYQTIKQHGSDYTVEFSGIDPDDIDHMWSQLDTFLNEEVKA